MIPQLHIERDVSRYVVGGQRVPSVTEVLALAGVVDFGGIAPAVLEQAAARGRLAHRITALVDLGELKLDDVDVDDEQRGYLAGYIKFREDTGFVPNLIEYSVVSKEHRYAGTFDRLGVARHGRVWLVDLKTSISVAPWVRLQLAGYELPAREILETQRIDRIALRLRRDGTYTMNEYRDRSDLSDFLACNRVAHWRLNHGGIEL